MRLGIFSDMHANYEALSAVLEAYRQRAHRRLLLPRRHRRLRRLAERVRRPRARDREDDDPRQPRRRRRRPHGLLVLLRGRAPRARHPRRDALAREHGVAEGACRTSTSSTSIDVAPLPRLAGAARGVRVHLRARAGARVPADLGRARPHHAHRPLAPLQGVRAHAEQRRGAARRSTSSSSRTRSTSCSVGSRRPAARLRQPRELHGLRHATRSASSSSASSTTSRPPPTKSSAPSSSATSRTASSSASEGYGQPHSRRDTAAATEAGWSRRERACRRRPVARDVANERRRVEINR